VFGDLQPYVCIIEDCIRPECSFSRRRDWIDHHMHHSTESYKLDCPFCGGSYSNARSCWNHIANHQEQLALFVLAQEVLDSEDEDSEDEDSDEVNIKPSSEPETMEIDNEYIDNAVQNEGNLLPEYRWWIRSEGISRAVISREIQRYLGPDALVKPGTGRGRDEVSWIELNLNGCTLNLSRTFPAIGSPHIVTSHLVDLIHNESY
jgi:hypothetical protein